MKEHPPLFKLTSGGAVQVWRIQQEGHRFRTVHGAMNGAQVSSGWTEAKSKNLGRSNGTSAEQQACLMIQARYVKQLEQGGYSDTLETAGRHSYFVPMLARVWKTGIIKPDQWKRSGEVFTQPKLDGMRMLLRSTGAWSRKGKRIMTADHIISALRPVFRDNPDLVIDGELYNHDLADDFPRLMSLARKTKPTAEDIYEATRTLQFHVFDAAGSAGHLPFWERYQIIEEKLQAYVMIGEPIRLVPTWRVRDYEHLDESYQRMISDGYEGQMIRIHNDLAGYDVGPNRSPNLLKRKEFLDKEFYVVELLEGEGNWSGCAKAVRYMTEAGEFSSGIRGNRAYLEDLWKRRAEFKEGLGTVRFQEWSPKKIPRFPVTVALWEKHRTH